MLPRHPRSAIRALALTAASALVLLNAPLRLAADEVVEIADPYQGQRGHLRPLERLTTPVINPASDEATQALSRMKVPAGLKAELWAAEPMFANPVAFNLDEKGRVFVSETHRYGSSVLDIRDYMWILEDDLANRTQDDFTAMVHRLWGEDGVKELSKESERLVLLEDTNGDGKADKSSVYADNFRTAIDGIASGVVIRHNDVWFSNIPALWKFTGHDKAETRTELLRGFGLRFNFTGHDFHGLILGPDGRIYMSIGDRGAYINTKEGGAVDSADMGSVFRCWPDGTGFELFATGLRNPQSLLFNEYGDLFTGDNDSDQGDQERLVHVVQDGDSGWRVGYQHAPRGNAGPWNAEKMWHPRNAAQPNFLLPPICNIEDGPSGIAYYPGTGLTPAYAGTLFITHFKGSISNSGIFAYTVKPSGASYAIATAEPFLTGALPTDVRFGPDGKMYYSDWGEGWPKSKRGRIYTIFSPDVVKDPATQQVKATIASDFTKKSDDELAALLANADWRIRLEAQYTLADRGTAGIAKFSAAAASDNALARRHAVWGLGQIARHEPKALDALRPLLASTDAEVRAQAASLLGDLRDAASADALIKALGDSAPRVKFFAAQALGKLKSAAATSAPTTTPTLTSATRSSWASSAAPRRPS
jgi:quinoprotein glucose dehydrogenase